jgi:uncharacterized protein YwqG
MMTLEQIEARLRSAAVPAIHLSASHDDTVSKIGGFPDVVEGFVWPVWNDAPLAFIAQLDLATLPSLAASLALPKEGMLYFFYDQEQFTFGFDPKDLGSWRVIYSPLSYTEKTHITIDTPDGLDDFGIYVEKLVSPRLISSFPTLESLDIQYKDLPDGAFDVEHNLRSEFIPEGPLHQIGGYPAPIQNDGMQLQAQLASNGLYCGDASGYKDPKARVLEAGAADWQLLLQVDTDSDLDMMWGDAGCLYFWIRKQDLLLKDFSKVWMVSQCH